MKIGWTTSTPEETVAIGRRLGKKLRQGDVVALVGPLGAGKTHLIQGMVAGLGAGESQVSSPTFIMMNEYETDPPLVHIDAYRINSLAELESIGYSTELLRNSITVIEWADRIESELPENVFRIEMNHVEGGRSISMIATGPAEDRIKTFDMQKTIHCSVCGQLVDMHSAAYPFCSSRCRMIDLGKWFDGDYSLSRPLKENDLNEQD